MYCKLTKFYMAEALCNQMLLIDSANVYALTKINSLGVKCSNVYHCTHGHGHIIYASSAMYSLLHADYIPISRTTL